MFLRIDVNTEDAVGPRWLGIHVGGSDGSIFETHVHVLFHFGDGIYLNLSQIFDEDSFLGTFLELHFSFGVFAKQVMDLLVVNLNKTATY